VVRTLVAGGTYVDPTLPGPVSGGDLNGYINALVAAFPDMAFTTERIIAAGDLVVLQWRMAGTNLGPLPGALAPTGARPTYLASTSSLSNQTGSGASLATSTS
jgi:predicted ester cyclase